METTDVVERSWHGDGRSIALKTSLAAAMEAAFRATGSLTNFACLVSLNIRQLLAANDSDCLHRVWRGESYRYPGGLNLAELSAYLGASGLGCSAYPRRQNDPQRQATPDRWCGRNDHRV